MSDYVTLDQFKEFLRLDIGDSVDDFTLTLCLDSAESSVSRFCDESWLEPEDVVPSAVKLAILLQANRYYKRRDAWAGIAGSPEMGNEMRLLSVLDFDVKVMLRPFKNYWWVAEEPAEVVE